MPELNPQKMSMVMYAVLVGICTGHSNRYIADRLDISEGVVKTYAERLRESAGVSSRLELAIYCYRNGIVKCPCKKEEESCAK